MRCWRRRVLARAVEPRADSWVTSPVVWRVITGTDGGGRMRSVGWTVQRALLGLLVTVGSAGAQVTRGIAPSGPLRQGGCGRDSTLGPIVATTGTRLDVSTAGDSAEPQIIAGSSPAADQARRGRAQTECRPPRRTDPGRGDTGPVPVSNPTDVPSRPTGRRGSGANRPIELAPRQTTGVSQPPPSRSRSRTVRVLRRVFRGPERSAAALTRSPSASRPRAAGLGVPEGWAAPGCGLGASVCGALEWQQQLGHALSQPTGRP
jgi:hypothetical protein